jgi:hypothetical protein
VDVEVRPVADDQDAILAAVEALLRPDRLPAAYRSGWRRRAIRENLGEDEGAAYEEAVRPATRPGATRA